jgi:uridine phosphorylase
LQAGPQRTTYLRPTAPIAADVLLPGDPALAMALARRLVESPLMANHAHGLWGYTGRTADGRELTVQSTGIGAPSAALVLRELAALGIRRAIRIGVGRPLSSDLRPGDTLLVEAAFAADGTARALGAGETALPDERLTAMLAGALGARATPATIASADIDLGASPAPDGAVAALDLETAALLAAARGAGIAAAAALLVGPVRGDSPEEPGEALLDLGSACDRAFADG